MKRISLVTLLGSALLSVVIAGAVSATPLVNGATIESRTFNDCPISILTTSNNYPASVEITDEMHPACVGFANLHCFSLSEDGGATAAVFDNNSNFRFAADFRIEGPGEGEGGLRISPWYGQFVDGRIMANATTGEIVCFGGAIPFYSFTVNNGIVYVKGTTIRFEVNYQANDLTVGDPATIQYRVVSGGITYDSPVLPFGQQNPLECDPNGLWGMLNDGRVGGYFQPRANTGVSLTANWSNIAYSVLESCVCVDTAPPSIDVTLSRDTLWPPNHKLVEVCATVEADDDCDAAPVVSLLSITSDEPDNGEGDGNTDNDIQFGEDDCFLLRSERQGGGDGRVYTIIYCVTDASGNTAYDTTTVVVPHDQSGSAFASLGFSEDGTTILPDVSEFALVLRSTASFSTGSVDASRLFVGNELGVLPAARVEDVDVDSDGSKDLRVFFDAGLTVRVLPAKLEGGSPVAFRYVTDDGAGYLVLDIFGLGPTIESVTTVSPPGDALATVLPPRPNPFESFTQIHYSVASGEGGSVDLAVYDASGRLVRTLFSGTRPPGTYAATWDGRHDDGGRAAAGVYFLKAEVGGHQSLRRMILMR